MEACFSTEQHEHLARQLWAKGTLLQDTTPMPTRAWAKHSPTAISRVQTQSCYFLYNPLHTRKLVYGWWNTCWENCLHFCAKITAREQHDFMPTRASEIFFTKKKRSTRNFLTITIFCEKILALSKFCKSFCKNLSYEEFFPSHWPCCHSSMLKKNVLV